jgi:hypothetical protein
MIEHYQSLSDFIKHYPTLSSIIKPHFFLFKGLGDNLVVSPGHAQQ